jgi:hypothetical protein
MALGRRMRVVVGVFEMQFARPIGTNVLIPTIPISRDPGIDSARKKMNAGDQQEPRQKFPAGK